jgi:hypothetical protein
MKTEIVVLGRHVSMASRSRRRRLVAMIYAGFAVLVVGWSSVYGESPAGWLIVVAFLVVARLLGGRTYQHGLLPPFESGDERERLRRNHAYYVAYKWWDLTLLPAMLAVGLKNNSFYPEWQPAFRIFVDRLPYGLLLGAGILYYTLPQAILLWTERDMELPQ